MIIRIVLFGVLIIGVAIVAARMSGAWDKLLAQGPILDADFATLVPQDTPNTYLVCPEDVCAATTPDAVSPTTSLEPAQLVDRIVAIAEADGATQIERSGADAVEMVVRTPIMRWPDRISVRAYPTADGSTFAFYSRSVYGESDLGANKARDERWMAQLKQ